MTVTRTFRIDVDSRHADHIPNWVSTLQQLGHAVRSGHTTRLFFLQGTLTPAEADDIAAQLLADPVVETYTITELNDSSFASSGETLVEVTLQPGVTDPAAENLVRAAHRLGYSGVAQAATGQRYRLPDTALDSATLASIATNVFANPVIQRTSLNQPITPPFIATHAGDGLVETIALSDANDEQLLAISKERRLSLDLAEMQSIRAYYERENREPTDIELEMLAQTWSEHCVHKTFRAVIDFTGPRGETERINGLLKTYIRAATETVNKPWVRSAFVDNAGIIAFDDQFDLAFKVETHNHPSALEPFGGANTGVGGVVRDVLGVSARPIANTDVLMFGEQDMLASELPEGVLHPSRIAEGVIRGVEDYGNKMGIPTVGGAIFYDKRYAANPLVFCGCVGLIPRGAHRTQANDGDLIIVIGGRTGRDGLRGATFSSMEMDTSTSEIASISVQIGHPIQEKQVQEVILRTRDEGLYTAITDCGAGGLSSAVGEMGKDLGAQVELTTVPLKYPGLRPWEIWLSEAQERMVIAVPPANWARVQEIAKGQDVEAVCIGTYTSTGRLDLAYDGTPVGTLDMHFLHEGIPTRHLKAEWKPVTPAPSATEDKSAPDFTETLLKLLAHPNIRSKEATIRRYDHEVQAGTVVKPLVGTKAHGPSDGAVIVPLDTKHRENAGAVKGFALGHGLCPQYTDLDPYAMAWAAVDEAFRNVVAIGADPDQVALLDNFCWGNPNLPDRLGSLVLAAKGCHDAAVAYGAPFISGKDSLNNEYNDADGTRHAIPGTLLISAIATVPDVTKTVTMDLKQEGNQLLLVGKRNFASGGSHYNRLMGLEDGMPPQPNPDALNVMRALHKAIQAGLVQSCHDVSEGGIPVALAEMCIAGSLGVYIEELFDEPGDLLFQEMTGCFIVEVKESDTDRFIQIFADQYRVEQHDTDQQIMHLGYVRATSLTDGTNLNIPLVDLERAWRGDLIDAEPLPLQPLNGHEARPVNRTVSKRTSAPKALILHANGSNRDRDAALACEVAGAVPEIVHMNQLAAGERRINDYDMLIVPGGFSYGDDLGAGVLWAFDLRQQFRDELQTFVQAGKPVLGICNGFQTLVKAGLLPTSDFASGPDRRVTLTYNEVGHFECRQVYLQPQANSTSLFTEGLSELILCPVAHGEGRVMARDEAMLADLKAEGLVPLTYVNAGGEAVAYPGNPNGSPLNIAALCNAAGNVMGLMPHPEDHIFPWQNPRYHRGERGQLGLVIFQNAVKYA